MTVEPLRPEYAHPALPARLVGHLNAFLLKIVQKPSLVFFECLRDDGGAVAPVDPDLRTVL
jgi:hypothetical protein